ncbi:MAG: DsbA family protein [Pseudomonadota bacterium]
MAQHTLRVYTDYRSPYAYLANADILALGERDDVSLDWYPYILPIEQYLGTEDSRTGHQWRRIKYAYKDARRLAEDDGLVLFGAKRIFDGYLSSAGLLFAKANGFFPAYHALVFSQFFKRELELDDLDAMAAAVKEAGGSDAAFRDYAEGEGRDAVKAVISEAEDMGVFGVPMLVLDDELFWGREKIPMVIKRLEAGAG